MQILIDAPSAREKKRIYDKARNQRPEIILRRREMAFQYRKRNQRRYAEYQRQWRVKNPGKSREYQKRHFQKAPESVRAAGRRFYHRHRKKLDAAKKQYCAQNRDSIAKTRRATLKRRYANDESFRLLSLLRARMRLALKNNAKTSSALKLLGCSIADFKIYLESKFESGMTWENRGKVWHIDHIMPCAIFDLSKPEHQKRCFHFSNLQPLFARENLTKRDKALSPQFALL